MPFFLPCLLGKYLGDPMPVKSFAWLLAKSLPVATCTPAEASGWAVLLSSAGKGATGSGWILRGNKAAKRLFSLFFFFFPPLGAGRWGKTFPAEAVTKLSTQEWVLVVQNALNSGARVFSPISHCKLAWNSITGALLSTSSHAKLVFCTKAMWTDFTFSPRPCMWLETCGWFWCRYTWTPWDLSFGNLVSLCLLERQFFPGSHQYAAVSLPKCFSSLDSCACYFRLAKHLRSLPLLQVIHILMDDFAFQCCEISEGTATCLSLTSCSWVISGKMKQTEPWQEYSCNQRRQKTFSAKLLPLVLLSLRKNMEVGRCWIWAAEDFAPSHLPGRMGSDTPNSCLLLALAGRVVCRLVSEAWDSTQILHVWSSDK